MIKNLIQTSAFIILDALTFRVNHYTERDMYVSQSLIHQLLTHMIDDEALRASLFDRLGVNDSIEERLLPLEVLNSTYSTIREITGDEFVGWNYGIQFILDGGGVLGYLLKHSSTFLDFTLGEKMILTDYFELMGDPLRVEVVETDEKITTTIIPNPEWVKRDSFAVEQESESLIAFQVAALSELTGMKGLPQTILLRRNKPSTLPDSMLPFADLIQFEAKQNSVVISRETALLPIKTYNQTLLSTLRLYTREYLVRLDGSKRMADMVRQILMKWLSQSLEGKVPTISTVSDELSLSPRSLQRQLEREGTSFKELSNEVRIDWAKLLLQNENRSIAEIAYMLNYSDPSAFTRFFKEQTGMTPGEYKEAKAD